MSIILLPFAFLAGLVVGAIVMRALARHVLRGYRRREAAVREGLASMSATIGRLDAYTGEDLAEHVGLPPDIDTTAVRSSLAMHGDAEDRAILASLASNGRTRAPGPLASSGGRRLLDGVAAGDELGDQLEELLGDVRALLCDHGTVQHVDGDHCVACLLVGRIDRLNAAAAHHDLEPGPVRVHDLGEPASPRITVGDEWSIDALERAALAYGRHDAGAGVEVLPRPASERGAGLERAQLARRLHSSRAGELAAELLGAARKHAEVTDAQRGTAPPAAGPLVHAPTGDDDAEWSCYEDGDTHTAEDDDGGYDLESVTCPHCLAREVSYRTDETREAWDRLEAVTRPATRPPLATSSSLASAGGN